MPFYERGSSCFLGGPALIRLQHYSDGSGPGIGMGTGKHSSVILSVSAGAQAKEEPSATKGAIVTASSRMLVERNCLTLMGAWETTQHIVLSSNNLITLADMTAIRAIVNSDKGCCVQHLSSNCDSCCHIAFALMLLLGTSGLQLLFAHGFSSILPLGFLPTNLRPISQRACRCCVGMTTFG